MAIPTDLLGTAVRKTSMLRVCGTGDISEKPMDII